MSSRLPIILVALVVAVPGCGDGGTATPAPAPAAEGGLATSRPAAEGAVPAAGDWKEAAGAAVQRGAEWLFAAAEDGKWSFDPERGPDLGITALVALALLEAPGASNGDRLRPTLDWMLSQQKEDGSIHTGMLATYCTAASVLALKASGDPRYDAAVARAVEFLRAVQLDEGDGLDESSENYGGIGYGGSGKTNMSTTQWAIDAASAAGLPKDDAFYRKALVFLQRSQNRSESNDKTHLVEGQRVESGNDGGGVYAPGESKAGVQVLPDGRRVFRSYGSMSYALLKSYLLCDLDPRDDRVRAVFRWIEANWELEHNPGMEHVQESEARYMGLYYYYLTIARTLDASAKRGLEPEVPGDGGWKADLTRTLVASQRADGSWINDQDRWWEGSPALVTAYALLALEKCLR